MDFIYSSTSPSISYGLFGYNVFSFALLNAFAIISVAPLSLFFTVSTFIMTPFVSISGKSVSSSLSDLYLVKNSSSSLSKASSCILILSDSMDENPITSPGKIICPLTITTFNLSICFLFFIFFYPRGTEGKILKHFRCFHLYLLSSFFLQIYLCTQYPAPHRLLFPL